MGGRIAKAMKRRVPRNPWKCHFRDSKFQNVPRCLGPQELVPSVRVPIKAAYYLLSKLFDSSDLPSCIQFSKIMMYTDDTVIYLSSTSTSDIELKLNLDLANLSQWFHYNKLVLNMKKTEFMTFGTCQRLARQKCDKTDISLNGQSIN